MCVYVCVGDAIIIILAVLVNIVSYFFLLINKLEYYISDCAYDNVWSDWKTQILLKYLTTLSTSSSQKY